MVLLEWFSVRTFLLQIPGVTLKIHWDLNETWDDHEAQLACNFKHSKMCSHRKYFLFYFSLACNCSGHSGIVCGRSSKQGAVSRSPYKLPWDLGLLFRGRCFMVLRWWRHKSLIFLDYAICWDILKEQCLKGLLAKNYNCGANCPGDTSLVLL